LFWDTSQILSSYFYWWSLNWYLYFFSSVSWYGLVSGHWLIVIFYLLYLLSLIFCWLYQELSFSGSIFNSLSSRFLRNVWYVSVLNNLRNVFSLIFYGVVISVSTVFWNKLSKWNFFIFYMCFLIWYVFDSALSLNSLSSSSNYLRSSILKLRSSHLLLRYWSYLLSVSEILLDWSLESDTSLYWSLLVSDTSLNWSLKSISSESHLLNRIWEILSSYYSSAVSSIVSYLGWLSETLGLSSYES